MTAQSENHEDAFSRQLIDTITKGISQSYYAAVIRARFCKVPLIVWENGKIVELDPETVDVPPEIESTLTPQQIFL